MMKDPLTDGIAIIGMAGRFPGAGNVDEFWSNLVAGVESISTFTDEELAASGLDVAGLRKDPSYVPSRGILENAEWFDAGFFGINHKQAEVTDPQQRLFLEASLGSPGKCRIRSGTSGWSDRCLCRLGRVHLLLK